MVLYAGMTKKRLFSIPQRENIVMALTDTAICNAKPKDKPYKLSDEKGMYLLIKNPGSILDSIIVFWQTKNHGLWCLP